MEQQAEYGKVMTISSLTAAKYNPRKITQENFEGLTYSIKEFGDLSGITFNRTTGNLVTGHQRVRSLMQEFGEDLPIAKNGILLPDGSHFHVRFVEWDEKKEVAANIAANNPHLQGEFTVDLQTLLADINRDTEIAFDKLRFDALYNEDDLFDSIRTDLAGYDPRKHGWLQPILVTQHNVIIDGFHRWSISKKNGWQVPCIVFDMTEQERKLLTIRINRAKGTHVAVRMSDIVKSLVNDGLSREYVAEQIGAKIFEVNLLLEDSIFTKHNVEQHTYSKSWVPNKKK